MSFPNIPKTFKYVNELGDSITFLYANGFLINKPNGIDTLSVSHNLSQGINQVGATVQSYNVQSRQVTFSGRVVGDDQDANKQKLLSVIRPDLTARLYADDYYLEVRPTETPTIEGRGRFANFQFSLLAAYPYWAKDEFASAALVGVEGRFRLWDGDDTHLAPDGTPGIWDISGSYSFGELIETQFINIPNRGQLPIPFTLEFYARSSVENPKITNVLTGQYLRLVHTLAAGERVVVEITHERTYVTSSVNGDIRGALSLSSKLNRLEVGDNVLKPEADSGGTEMEVTISYAPEIVGVIV